jgi:hypothetical protein
VAVCVLQASAIDALIRVLLAAQRWVRPRGQRPHSTLLNPPILIQPSSAT